MRHTNARVDQSENFVLLERNRELKNKAYLTRHEAITVIVGSHVRFATKPIHVGRNVTSEDNHDKERVDTVTIDDLFQQYHQDNGAIFIKLDVEGVEVDAMEGARETLKAGSIPVYEDHAKDRKCLPTVYLLTQGKRVYCLGADVSVTLILSVGMPLML